jgi:type VI secretion system protein ImpI/type VI secretion system protein
MEQRQLLRDAANSSLRNLQPGRTTLNYNGFFLKMKDRDDEDPNILYDVLIREPDPDREGGASAPNHSPATRDFYAPNTGAGGIPDDWEDDFLSGDEDPFNPPASTSTTPEPPADAPVAPVLVVPEAVVSPAAAPSATPVATGSGADLARKFLQAAGVNDAQITDDELADIMTRSGIVFKTLVEGAREVLMARASIKDELKLGQTMISPDGNNPIKFSISGQQAVEAMIKPTVAGYKLGPASAEEAMRDIKAHEIAMMSGMERAIQSLLGLFNPNILAQKLEDDGGVRGLLKGKKARYWEVFEKLYDQISEEAEEDFHSLFGKEFGKAYKEQMQKLKTTHGKET